MIARILHAWKDATTGDKAHGLHAEWVRSTWVCKRWREVAFGTAALWSSVLVSRRRTNSAALEMQLDRARSSSLDLLVLSRRMSKRRVEEALNLILSTNKTVKKVKVLYDTRQAAIIETFVKRVRADIVSLSLRPNAYLPPSHDKWEITPVDFPRLFRLNLKAIVPIPGALLLNLTQLSVDHVIDNFSPDAEEPWTRVHRFLAACPNLHTLRVIYSFEFPLEQLYPHGEFCDLPVVTLRNLRHLQLEGLALDMSTALGALRLPALISFHIRGTCGRDPYDCDFYIIPQNVSDALPPIRRSRSLSLTVGGPADANSLSLRGSPCDNISIRSDDDGAKHEDGWSLTLGDWEPTTPDSQFLNFPCCVHYNCARFLARLPHLVVPSALVSLELHIADGLPIAQRDWARFFAGMVHLQRLEIGGGALIRRVLEVFAAPAPSCARLCAEVEHLGLCFGHAVTCEGAEGIGRGLRLGEFVARAIGAWVGGRDGARPSNLKTVTVRTRWGSGVRRSGVEPGSSLSYEGVDCDVNGRVASLADGEGSAAWHSWSAGLMLRGDLADRLKVAGSVDEVFLTTTRCRTCGVIYKTVDADEIGDGELSEGVAYY
ncbi:hypothetical protein V8D89_006670 [Ganoderma adspersum]